MSEEKKKETVMGREVDRGNTLFNPTLKKSKIETLVVKEVEYKRATFHLEPATIEAINIVSFEEMKGISEVVRDILTKSLGEELLERGKKRYEDSI